MIDIITVLALLEEHAGDNSAAVLHAAIDELARLRTLQAAAVDLAREVLDVAGEDTIPFDVELVSRSASETVSGLRKLAAEVLRLAEDM